jgi:hypothetical protein
VAERAQARSPAPAEPEPCWFYPSSRAAPSPATEAEDFLRRLDEEDRHLIVLVHGLSLDLGSASRALRLDPSIVSWRVRHALQRGAHGGDPAALERGVAALLSGRGRNGRTRADEIVERLPPDVRERLAEQRRGGESARAASATTAGLGIGSLVIILLAVAGFIVYGVIRDVNPLWRGQALARQGSFEEARRWLEKIGDVQEARAWIAITWLAEGQFDHALEVLHEPGVAQYFGDFQPVEGPLQPVEGGDPASGALLPRGTISEQHPRFVFRAAPAGTLSLEVQLLGRPGAMAMTRSVPVADTLGSSTVVERPYPTDWPALSNVSALWTAPGDTGNAAFTALSNEERIAIQDHVRINLSPIPTEARAFLRAQYLLKNKLYTQAGAIVAGLARQFPEQPWPKTELAFIAEALAVDPSVFLR